jgi:hypothetical protein
MAGSDSSVKQLTAGDSEAKSDVTRNLPANYETQLREAQLQKEFEEHEVAARRSNEEAKARAASEAEMAKQSRAAEQAAEKSAEKARQAEIDRAHKEAQDRKGSRKAMFDVERDRIRKEKADEAKRVAAQKKAYQDSEAELQRQQQEAQKEQDRINREEGKRQQAAAKEQEAYRRNLDRAQRPSQRANIRQAMEDQKRKEDERQRKFQQQQAARTGAIIVGGQEPKSYPLITALGSGLGSIGRSLDRQVTGHLGGFADSLVVGRPVKQSNKLFRQETKAVSGAVRNKELGRNPFKQVIGASGTSRIAYETDGHGRSGRRATLEWRRENRQYTSEARANAAAINRNWVSEVAGVAPEPVRQRTVHTRHGRRLSPLEAFVNRL